MSSLDSLFFSSHVESPHFLKPFPYPKTPAMFSLAFGSSPMRGGFIISPNSMFPPLEKSFLNLKNAYHPRSPTFFKNFFTPILSFQ